MVFIFVFGVNRFATVAHTTHTYHQFNCKHFYGKLSRSQNIPLKIRQHFTMNLCSNKEEKAKTWKSLAEYLLCAHNRKLYLCLDITCNLPRTNNQKAHKESASHGQKNAPHIYIGEWGTIEPMSEFTFKIGKISAHQLQSFRIKYCQSCVFFCQI